MISHIYYKITAAGCRCRHPSPRGSGPLQGGAVIWLCFFVAPLGVVFLRLSGVLSAAPWARFPLCRGVFLAVLRACSWRALGFAFGVLRARSCARTTARASRCACVRVLRATRSLPRAWCARVLLRPHFACEPRCAKRMRAN